MPIKRRSFLFSSVAALLGSPCQIARAGEAILANSPKIKIGQIGTAHAHAAGKIQTMRKLSEHFDVVGIVEPDKKRRAAVADQPRYRGVAWLTEDQLLGHKGIQAVAVETSVRELVPTAMRCIEAGVHVHLDKPAGETMEDFRRVVELATSRNLVIQMGYMLRYNPAFQFLFQAVKDGWLGEIFEIHGVMSKTVDDRSRQQLAEFQGGSMFELGCHLIDALVAVMGKPDRVTAYKRQTRADRDDLFDNMLAVFDYRQATATIRSALVEVAGQRRRQFVVCGQQGTIDIRPLEPPQLTLTLAKPRGKFPTGTHQVPLARLSGRYDGDFLDFAQIIRGDKHPDYGPDHDLAVHESILRASGVL